MVMVKAPVTVIVMMVMQPFSQQRQKPGMTASIQTVTARMTTIRTATVKTPMTMVWTVTMPMPILLVMTMVMGLHCDPVPDCDDGDASAYQAQLKYSMTVLTKIVTRLI